MGTAKDLGVGDCFRIKNDIFIVIRREVVSVGKHSHSRVKLTVENLNGGGEKQMVYSHEDKLDTLDVRRIKGQVVSKGKDVAQVMDPFTYETFDAEVDAQLLSELTEGDTVMYADIEGRRKVLEKLRAAGQ